MKKLFTLVSAVAFCFAVYSPSASACPGMEDDNSTKTAEKNKDKKADKNKVANKKKAADKNKKKPKKSKAKKGKKVSSR